jgi:hypothetical protein
MTTMFRYKVWRDGEVQGYTTPEGAKRNAARFGGHAYDSWTESPCPQCGIASTNHRSASEAWMVCPVHGRQQK